nr:hypothetical protein [Helicobacter cynogastricus]
MPQVQLTSTLEIQVLMKSALFSSISNLGKSTRTLFPHTNARGW